MTEATNGVGPSGKVRGRIKWFDIRKGYGFIIPNAGSLPSDAPYFDVFLSKNRVPPGVNSLRANQKCQYVWAMGKRGPYAKEFELI